CTDHDADCRAGVSRSVRTTPGATRSNGLTQARAYLPVPRRSEPALDSPPGHPHGVVAASAYGGRSRGPGGTRDCTTGKRPHASGDLGFARAPSHRDRLTSTRT